MAPKECEHECLYIVQRPWVLENILISIGLLLGGRALGALPENLEKQGDKASLLMQKRQHEIRPQ
jgi:hypothetical protein